MPWDYILGSAGGAGLVFVFGILLAKQVIEKMVDTRFAAKMEQVRAELTRKLEFDKSDLSVWADLRKDILVEMWKAYRDIVKQMTQVIISVQKRQGSKERIELRSALDEYRKMVHGQIDLLSPQAISICQRFLGDAYEILEGTKEPEDGNPLKTIRGELYAYTAKLYGLEKMMPWMAGNHIEKE